MLYGQKERRKDTLVGMLRLGVAAVFLVALAAAIFKAVDAGELTLGQGALICNDIEEVIERIESFKGEVVLPEGCSFTQMSLHARMTLETKFRSHGLGLQFDLVRYEFHFLEGDGVGVYVKYGHFGIPQPLEPELELGA